MRGGAGKDIKMIILLILSCIFAVQAKSWSRQVTGILYSYYIIILAVQAKSWSRQVTGLLSSYYIIILAVQVKSWSRQVTGILSYIIILAVQAKFWAPAENSINIFFKQCSDQILGTTGIFDFSKFILEHPVT